MAALGMVLAEATRPTTTTEKLVFSAIGVLVIAFGVYLASRRNRKLFVWGATARINLGFAIFVMAAGVVAILAGFFASIPTHPNHQQHHSPASWYLLAFFFAVDAFLTVHPKGRRMLSRRATKKPSNRVWHLATVGCVLGVVLTITAGLAAG